MGLMNRLGNATNLHQGKYKKVLCVCSAGLLRSPTAAVVLSQPPFNFNTRAAGVSGDYALVELDQVLLTWADEIVCMEKWHETEIRAKLQDFTLAKPIIVLSVPDDYPYRAPELMKAIKDSYEEQTLARPKES